MKSRQYATELTDARYKQCDKKKIGKKLFFEDLDCAWIAGYLTALDSLKKLHKDDPFETVDIALGEIHLLEKDCFNYFKTKYGFKNFNTLTIEKVL